MLIQFAVVVGLLGVFFIVVPSSLDPVVWKNVPSNSPPKMIDHYAPNDILSKFEKIGFDDLVAPESFAFDPKHGYAFASLGDGRIVKLSSTGKYLSTMYFRRAVNRHSTWTTASGDIVDQENMLKFCHNEFNANRLPWNPSNEMDCGRPLGIRFVEGKNGNSNFLVFADAYHGIFRIFLTDSSDSSSLELLSGPSQNISLPHNSLQFLYPDPILSMSPKFYNDLDIDEHGNIYFTDTSYRHPRSENRQELLDGAPRGRLLKYSLESGRTEVLLCGLHFPNGVQINGNSVLVVESARFRVLALNLLSWNSTDTITDCGEHDIITGSVSVFLDNVPGFMDNIRPSLFWKEQQTKTFLIGIGTKASAPFSLLHLAYQSKLLRDIVGRIIPMHVIEHLVPRYGFVMSVNEEGKVQFSWQSTFGANAPDGISLISQAEFHPLTGDLWLGSHSNPFLGILSRQHQSISH